MNHAVEYADDAWHNQWLEHNFPGLFPGWLDYEVDFHNMIPGRRYLILSKAITQAGILRTSPRTKMGELLRHNAPGELPAAWFHIPLKDGQYRPPFIFVPTGHRFFPLPSEQQNRKMISKFTNDDVAGEVMEYKGYGRNKKSNKSKKSKKSKKSNKSNKSNKSKKSKKSKKGKSRNH